MTATTISYKKSASLVPGGNLNPRNVQRLRLKRIQLYLIKKFLSLDDCVRLIELALPQFTSSTTVGHTADLSYRTSKTCYLSPDEDGFVEEIENKISHCLGIRQSYSEAMQLQIYEKRDEYKPHYDFFNPTKAALSGQRTWTFMICLESATEGGGTHFLEQGLTLYPAPGEALVWNNLDQFGTPNTHTSHQGLPVVQGRKTIVTKWFKDRGKGRAWY